jgi:hypothetical protein
VLDDHGASDEHRDDPTPKPATFSALPRAWLKRATE